MDDASSTAPWPPGPSEGQPAVAIEFQMTPGLLGREMIAGTFRRLWPLLLAAFVLFELTELLKLDWAEPDFLKFVWMPFLGLALMICGVYLLTSMIARRTFETTPLWQRPMHVILTPTRLFTNAQGYQSAQDLALLHAVRETRESFLVYLNSGYMMIWPKEAIPDCETLQRVRDYLRDGLPGIAKIKLRAD
jgi:hypothetical protein